MKIHSSTLICTTLKKIGMVHSSYVLDSRPFLSIAKCARRGTSAISLSGKIRLRGFFSGFLNFPWRPHWEKCVNLQAGNPFRQGIGIPSPWIICKWERNVISSIKRSGFRIFHQKIDVYNCVTRQKWPEASISLPSSDNKHCNLRKRGGANSPGKCVFRGLRRPDRGEHFRSPLIILN